MDLHLMSLNARAAFRKVYVTSAEMRNHALLLMADRMLAHRKEIFDANAIDLENAQKENLAKPLLHRLKFGEEKLTQTTAGLRELASLEDPLGKTTLSREIADGMELYRVTCPIGVIGVIFESRPDALVQIASLALKSGNTVLLKGGREALQTNKVLCDILREAAEEAGIPADFAQLLETRDDVNAMLHEDETIDLIIPRGSKAFVRYIMDNSRIPVLGHSDGLCHVYIDENADLDKALKVALDSKTQNVSVCNAMETLLVHRSVADRFLPVFAEQAKEKGVELRGDPEVCSMISCLPATEEDWKTEYLDLVLSIKLVDSVTEAIEHINRFGSHHTDCIVTEDHDAASVFLASVDSAGVYLNVSTRFADGFVYGFGAEVGIATGKIHARGPMGLEGLTTYKYILLGRGQTMTEVKAGKVSYTHIDLNRSCPL